MAGWLAAPRANSLLCMLSAAAGHGSLWCCTQPGDGVTQGPGFPVIPPGTPRWGAAAGQPCPALGAMANSARVQASGSPGLHGASRGNLLSMAQQDLMGTTKHGGRRSNQFPVIDGGDHESDP